MQLNNPPRAWRWRTGPVPHRARVRGCSRRLEENRHSDAPGEQSGIVRVTDATAAWCLCKQHGSSHTCCLAGGVNDPTTHGGACHRGVRLSPRQAAWLWLRSRETVCVEASGAARRPRRSLVSGGRMRLTLFPCVRTVGNAALGLNRAATQLKGVFTSPERSGTGHRKLGQVEDSGLRSGASLSSSSHECLSSLSVHRIAGR